MNSFFLGLKHVTLLKWPYNFELETDFFKERERTTGQRQIYDHFVCLPNTLLLPEMNSLLSHGCYEIKVWSKI